MTLPELDTKLEYWRQVAESALNNTMEVYETPTYKALCEGKFSGETARKLGDCTKINKLVEQASQLKYCVDTALELRKGVTILNKNERIAEVEALLTKDSIYLGDEQTPLAERSLTGGATVTRRCSPKELLDQLTSAFDLAKALVSEIDAIQTTLLVKLDDTKQDLENFLAAHPESNGIAAARKKLRDIEILVITDPIGSKKILEGEILPTLQAALSATESEDRERRQLDASMALARNLAADLRTVHADAIARTAERKLKVTTRRVPPDPLPEAELEKTASWLATLQQTAATAEWRCVLVGLEKWISRARDLIESDRRAARESQKLVETRLELRGLLGALEAKTAGNGRAEDKELREIGQKARELLTQRPTPMEEAESLVRQYQSRS